MALKAADFWLRYLEPIAYKQLNGPLPVEWETEVFEKFEKPYKREGAGLTLAEITLIEEGCQKGKLRELIVRSIQASHVYQSDSILQMLQTPDHFFLCNRLFLLNLAAIYTTGFECPVPENIVPELRSMLTHVSSLYQVYNETFTDQPITKTYLAHFQLMRQFVDAQPAYQEQFDHFTFIKDFVNPLFGLNQQMILSYHVVSKSNMDFSLSKKSTSIFDKALYYGQNTKGIFHRVKDQQILSKIDHLGKLLFYDPILSGNNQRSCASCHQSFEHFTDTNQTTSLHYDGIHRLTRNTPSLLNAEFQQLLMLDGKHISLHNQTMGVLTNSNEMGGEEAQLLAKILSCKDYKQGFEKLLPHTPQENEVTMEHITSALTLYYSKFSQHYAPFDDAMANKTTLPLEARKGFNVFMGKAQCATCHFVPQFNGVKPPYIGSEFEVIGVPSLKEPNQLSNDSGRYQIHPANEMAHAFRTGTLRNIALTKPYMHNGAFKSLSEVIDFYNEGGGIGRGLKIENQTLSPDSLHLTEEEKNQLLVFLQSLNEAVIPDFPPAQLPASTLKTLNLRKVGGSY